MGLAQELARRERDTDLVRDAWVTRTNEAKDLVKQLPTANNSEWPIWVYPRVIKILSDQERLYRSISGPIKEDIDQGEIARRTFAFLKELPLSEDVPNGISYHIQGSKVQFHRTVNTSNGIIQPEEVIAFIRFYDLTCEDLTLDQVASRHQMSRTVMRDCASSMLWQVLNSPGVREVWSANE